jgi:hypothetical protein
MMATVWRRVRADGRPDEELHPTREVALAVGTANAHLYLEPEEVEVDAVFVIMRDDLFDECSPTVHAVAMDLGAATREADRLNAEHRAEMARRHGGSFGAVTEWRIDVAEVVR